MYDFPTLVPHHGLSSRSVILKFMKDVSGECGEGGKK